MSELCYNQGVKSYTSCFLGIPLPQEYMNEFRQLLYDIHAIDPFIETAQSQTPHVTIYYLNMQSQYLLEEIDKKIQPFSDILNKTVFTIGGSGYFTNDNSKILFLDVTSSEALIDYRDKVSEVLKKYSASDNSLPFHPHVTVGRIKSIQKKESFKSKEEIMARLNMVQWNFKLNEIALYGVDSTKSPEHQEKLLTIPVR